MKPWERRILAWFAERRLRIEREEREAARILEEIQREREREKHHPQHLSSIKLVFKLQHQTKGERAMAPVTGPVILTVAGQVALASVLGFDQNDDPMPADFKMPPVTFTTDDPEAAEIQENADGVTATITALADGLANITAKVISAEGKELTDEEQLEVELAAPGGGTGGDGGGGTFTPVLSSIKLVLQVQPPAESGGTAAPEGQSTTAAPGSAPLTPNQQLAGASSTGTGPLVTEIDPTKEPAAS